MATISRFIKNTVPELVGYKLLIYDSALHGRVFGPHDRRLCSKVFQDEDNEVLTKVNRQLFGRRPTFTKLNGDYNFSSEISSEKSNRILGPSSVKKDDKLKFFSSYVLAKKLGEVESLEDYLSHQNIYRIVKNLVNVPLACKRFNNCQFPNERSMHNWIKAVDFSLQKGWINSFSLSLALSSFAKLVNDYRSDQDKLLSGVGCDRLTTWFDFALEENCIPWEHNESIRNCIHVASYISIPAALKQWNLSPLYGRLNYSLSTYISAQLKDLEKFKDHEIFFEILEPIIKVETNLDQRCSLEQGTKDEIHDKQLISFYHNSTALLLCRWSVNDSQFWHDWLQCSRNVSKINEHPWVVSKQLQSLLLVLLKSNADPNFLRNDTNLAEYLADKVKPVFIEILRANGLRFVNNVRKTILMKLVMDCLHASESPFFTNEELREIGGILDPK